MSRNPADKDANTTPHLAPALSRRARARARAAQRFDLSVDERTKELIERAAQLERRKLVDYCISALTEAARRTIVEHSTVTLTESDREVFFAALSQKRGEG